MAQLLLLSRVADIKAGDRIMTHPSNTKYIFIVEKKEEVSGFFYLTLKACNGGENSNLRATANDILYSTISLCELKKTMCNEVLSADSIIKEEK